LVRVLNAFIIAREYTERLDRTYLEFLDDLILELVADRTEAAEVKQDNNYMKRES
jgi:hypothetical protein